MDLTEESTRRTLHVKFDTFTVKIYVNTRKLSTHLSGFSVLSIKHRIGPPTDLDRSLC